MGLTGAHTRRRRTYSRLTLNDDSLYQYTVPPSCAASSAGSVHNAVSITLKNVILQKCDSAREKKRTVAAMSFF